MKNRDFHDKAFDETTLEKLAMFREYLEAWLPVFIQSGSVKRLQVFDYFAGPGRDANQNAGSPLLACEVVKSARLPVKSNAPIPIRLYFNEKDADKYATLVKTLDNLKSGMPPHVEIETEQMPFAEAFEKTLPSMRDNVANLLFLDQFGVSGITQEVFQEIVRLPKTDFLFFVSSASVARFKEKENIRKYVPVTDDDCDKINMTNVHRIMANAYRHWLPQGVQRYYIAPFSLKRKGNVYGLVFGSGHPLGMEKFLQTAWKHGGDANFDIDDDRIDPNQGYLFHDWNIPTKIKQFEQELETAILNQEEATNKDIYEFALKRGMLAKHAKDKVEKMIKSGQLPKQKITISHDAWKKEPVLICREGERP